MRNVVVALFALVAFAGTAFAAPEVIEMKKGVKFPHKAHVAAVGNCKKCHEKAPGKIEGFGKEWAHRNCKGCHGERNAGPYHCAGCHAKVYD